ncbi:hypothetical protein D9M71_597110 [compost metagenome]
MGEQPLGKLDKLLDEGIVSLLGLTQLLGELAAIKQDGEDASLAFVAGKILDDVDAAVAQRQHRVAGTVVGEQRRHALWRQAHLIKHLVEQVGLVLEMPVHRAPGHPCLASDGVQAGV